jgi:hypothetical protein
MRPAGVRAGIFLLGLAGLLFQVVLTRLASAALNYHLAFLAVSAGVLGTGVGATWVACWGRPPAPGRVGPVGLPGMATAAAWTIALALAGFAWLPLGALGAPGLLALTLLAYPVMAAPYVCAGAAVTLALRTWPGRAGGLYAADLAGAGAGSLLAIPLMSLLGPPLAGAAAAGAAIGAVPLLAGGGRRCGLALSAGAVALATAVLPPAAPNVLATKPLAVYLDPLRHPGAARLATRWDATSRVDVFRSPGASLLWSDAVPGGGPAAGDAPPDLPQLLGMTIDGDALTALPVRSHGERLPYAGRLPASAAYAVAPRADVLVIGPGGGLDVAAALSYGATGVEAVEVNPGVAGLVLGPLAAAGGNLYREPGVRLVVDEGRSYLQRSPRRYDAIVLTAVDSWAALASGSYSLAESYLYTEEAIGLYLDRLNEGGVLAVSRWLTAPPKEVQRLATVAGEAVRVRGGSAAGARLLLRAPGGEPGGPGGAGGPGEFGTLLVRRGSFTADELQRVRAFAAAGGLTLYAGDDLAALLAPASAADATAARPATDDRPYFFDFLPWSRVLRGDLPAGGLPRGHAVLLLALIQGLCLGVAGVVVPRRRLPRWCRGRRRLRLGAFAGAAGLGFMLAEMALLQRLTLLLGQPGLSLALSLAGLLLGAGLGAAGWRRAAGRPALALAGAATLLALQALLLPALAGTAIGWPLPARIGLALGATFLPAVLMGTALPLCAAGPGRSDPAVLPWLWAVNGAASAVGAALAVLLAMEWGGRAVLLGGAALYLAMAALLGAGRRAAPPDRVDFDAGSDPLAAQQTPAPRGEPAATL